VTSPIDFILRDPDLLLFFLHESGVTRYRDPMRLVALFPLALVPVRRLSRGTLKLLSAVMFSISIIEIFISLGIPEHHGCNILQYSRTQVLMKVVNLIPVRCMGVASLLDMPCLH
jgi:hypothetical protein